MKSVVPARQALQPALGRVPSILCRITWPLVCGVSVLFGSISKAAPPALTAPAVSNVGANQVTLALTSSATGSGYFTLLAGAAATPGSGAQTKAGQDSSGAAAFRFGSLPLAAGVAGSYTVRNLASNTAYTVCFTADDGTTLQPTATTTSFSTTPAVDLTTKDWAVVGAASFTTSWAWYPSLAFAPDGTPYLAFQDGGNLSKATVVKFDGTAWAPVGSAGFSANQADYTSLAFAPDGTPHVAFMDYANSQKATVMKFGGGTWSVVGGAGFSAGAAYYVGLAFGPDGVPCVAYRDSANSSKATVMKLNGTTWSPMGAAGFSPDFADSPSLAFAPDGSPWLAFEDGAHSSRTTVMKFNGAAWTTVGAAGFSTNAVSYGLKLAFAPDGTPHVAYREDAGGDFKATVMKFQSGAWTAVGSERFTAGWVSYPTLAIAADGAPCVAFADATSNRATVMRFGGSAWSAIGRTQFSPFGIEQPSMAFAPDGTPYLAFFDRLNGSAAKATVMKMAPTVSAAPTVASVATPSAGTYVPGQNLNFTVTFNAAVNVTGTPRIALTIGSAPRYANYVSGSAGNALVFRYTVQSGDTGTITLGGSIELNGGTIAAAAGGAAATLTLNGVGSTSGVIVATPPTLTTPTVANLGANQATLGLKSSATGTGYFTLLTGTATPGTGAQTKAGQDGSGAAAARFGSLALTANTAGSYTVRNLASNTTYTVCFTADDGSALQPVAVTTSFTTATTVDLAGRNWLAVGPAGFSTDFPETPVLEFAPNGTPYVGYREGAANNYKASVMKYEGGAWVQVGAVGFSPDEADSVSLAFSPDGTPHVAFGDYAHGVRATVMKFSAGAWVTVGSPGFSANDVGHLSLAFSPDGKPYVAFQDNAYTNKGTLMKFDGSAWTVVGFTGSAPSPVHRRAVAFGPNGSPLVAGKDSDGMASLMKFDGTGWVPVGTNALSSGSANYVSLALGSDGTPYVAYCDGARSSKTTVMKLDGGAWSAVGSAGFSSLNADFTSLAITPDGMLCLAFTTDSYANAMKFNAGTWSSLGSANFSAGAAEYTSLVIAPDGTPFIAYLDYANGSKATVMKMAAPAGPVVASVTVPSAGTYLPTQNLNFTVNFSAAVNVTGTPRIALTIGSATRYANYVSGSGTTAIVFRYTVQSGDTGTLALGGAIELNGGTIAAAAGGTAATLTLNGVGSTSGVIVATPPTLTTPTVANLGANQATLALKSSATGTGYFTLLTGSASPGTGAQTKAGQDGSGATATRFGSLALTANTAGSYTIRNLAANTTYTLCFTADDGAALQPTVVTASFTTGGAIDSTGRSWTVVGSRGFSGGSTVHSALAFAADGTPFVTYTDMPWDRKATVMKFTASAWEVVGARGISTVKADFPSLGISPNDTAFLAYRDSDNVAGGQSTVMKFDSTWSVVGGAGFSVGQAAYASVAFAPDGALLVAFADSGRAYKATVMKFDGSAWSALGTAGFSPGPAHWVTLAVAPNGVPMIAYRDDSLSGKATVMKFDGSTWTVVGTAGFSLGEVVTPTLAFAPDGTPYLGYTDHGSALKATVMKFNGSAWVTVGAPGLSADQANYTSLAIAPDGVPWIAYGDAANNYKATVMKFNGSSWIAVGAAAFSPGDVAYTSLGFAPDGTPFVAFQDVPFGDRMTVMKLAVPAPTAPVVASVSVPAPGTYLPGDALNFTVNFSAAVNVTGAPRIPVTIGSTTRYATYVSGSGSTAILFRYTVQSGDSGSIGLAGSIELNGGTIAGTTGGAAANLTLSGVGSTGGVIIVSPPTLTTPIVSNLGSNQVTLALQSNATGTGYFTLLVGANATPGTGAQTKAGKDSTGAAAFRFGSLPLTAGTAGSYTVRNLTSNTAYTVCFTADDGTTLQPNAVTKSFTTSAATVLAGTNWAAVGTVDFPPAPTSYTYGLALAFAPDGTPYAGYQDSSRGDKMTVMKFDGSAWTLVGAGGFSPAIAANPTMAFAPDGTLYAAFSDGTYLSERATVMKFNGSAWTTVGSAGFSASGAFFISLAFAPDGAPHVAFRDVANSEKATVMKFAGSAWTVVGTAGFGDGPAFNTSLAFAPDGTPYVAYKDEGNGDRITVMKLAGSTWTVVGTAGFSAGVVFEPSLAFAPDGTPFVSYCDNANANSATVMKLVSGTWTVAGTAGFTGGGAGHPVLTFAPDNSPCVAYVDGAHSDKATVSKFNGTAWNALGTAGVGTGSVRYTTVAMAPDGTPFLAYLDNGNGGKGAVMKLAPVALITPTIAWSAPAAITYGTALSATQLNATASAGGANVPGTFAYTPPAGTVLNAGADQTLSVTFTPTDAMTYTTATASTTITVNRAPATVALSGLSATYDGASHAATVATTPVGLAVSVTYDGGSTAPTNAGDYAVVATITDPNYVGTTSGTLSIAKASQVITFAALPPKTTADAPFGLGATASSGLPVSYASSNPAVATVSGSTVTIVAAGSTTITASQVGNANYLAATDVTQTLTVSIAVAPPPPPIIVVVPPPVILPPAPALASQPASQQVVEGSSVTFSVTAVGTGLSYQWKKDGANIPGAQSAQLTLLDVKVENSGAYSVLVWNAAASVLSESATLTVRPRVDPPAIASQPSPQAVDFGGTAVFSVTASGTAPLAYQWSKDGVPIAGATGSTLTLNNAQASSSGTYSVTVTNSAGRRTSSGAALTVAARELAAAYFGTFGAAPGRAGTFALFVRPDRTAAFLGYECSEKTAFVERDVVVDSNRRFRVVTSPAHGLSGASASGTASRYEIAIDGAIGPDGSITGSVSGAFNLPLSAPAPAASRVCASLAGFYQAGCSGSSAVSYTIVGATGEAYTVAINGTSADAGKGTSSAAGSLVFTTENSGRIEGTIAANTGTICTTLTPATGAALTFDGANNDSRTEVERLSNVSTRGRTGGGAVLIAGFSIAGDQAKPVLVRAIGPTLGTSFRVGNALSAARLEVFKGSISLAASNDWGTAANAAAIATTTAQIGAFPLANNSRDAALLLSLDPGSYTAVVTGQGSAAGVALVEVYDATTGSTPPTQRVINLSTRASVGGGEDALIAGFVITGSLPKRVLVRGVGPSLAQFPGIGAVLARPQITVASGSTILAQNTAWNTSADAVAIEDAASQLGAFPFATNSQDAALIVSLPPGAYTAEVKGAAGGTGVALVEVYEIP